MSVLALGMTAIVPSLAGAGVRDARDEHRPVPVEHRFDRDDRDRHDREIRVERDRDHRISVRVTPDCDVNVRLGDVPYGVLDTANRQHRGRIESARFIRRGGVEFYSVIVDHPGGDLALRIDPTGCLLSIDRC
jgi:hypothetical protein